MVRNGESVNRVSSSMSVQIAQTPVGFVERRHARRISGLAGHEVRPGLFERGEVRADLLEQIVAHRPTR